MLIWVLLLLKPPFDVVRVDVKKPFVPLLVRMMLLSNGTVAEYRALVALLIIGELLLLKIDDSGFSVLALDGSILE